MPLSTQGDTTESSGSGDVAFVLERVSKRYGSGPHSTLAVADISLQVRRGEFLCLMGASGCGKSTLLNLIAGLDAPDGGRVVVAGQDLAALSDNDDEMTTATANAALERA